MAEQLPTPTPRETEILKLLWEHGPLSVREVHRRMSETEDVAYNTVQTLLRLMEEKGLATHSAEGRTFIYSANFSRTDSASRYLANVFDGAASQLVLSLLQSKSISADELEKLHEMIAEARKKKSRG